MILFKLFLAFLRVGIFAIGGAYSFLPLVEREVVQRYNWLTREEFLDVLGMVKLFPGAISIKYATYTGYKMAGVPGIIVANLGNFLAPVIIIMFATGLYARYKNSPGIKGAFSMIQLAVFAMIVAVAFQLVNVGQLTQWRNLLVITVSFAIFLYTSVHPALIIIAAGILGFFLSR
jgi:chromate transporter